MQFAKNKMFDYIFLDLDGPILEGKYRHYECYKDIVNKFGGDILDINTYWNMKMSKVRRDVILKESAFKGSYEDFFNDWMCTVEDERYLKLDILKPQVIETLQKWKGITQKIVLVTMRQDESYLITQLQNLEVLSLLDEVIVCPPQRKNTKYEALKNIKFNKAIFIGDTEEDTNTAKMLNIKSIGITNGLRKKKFLDADYYYKEIKDINFMEIK